MACPIQSSYPTGWEADRPDFCYNVAPAEPSHKFDVVARGTDAGYNNRAPDGAARRRTSESAGSGSSSLGEDHRTWTARSIPPSNRGNNRSSFRWPLPSNAPQRSSQTRPIRVTHPYHPLFEQQFELIACRRRRGSRLGFGTKKVACTAANELDRYGRGRSVCSSGGGTFAVQSG